MASIDIRRRHSLSPERARRIVEDVVSGLSGKLGLRGAWEGNRFEFRRSGVDGEIAVAEDEIRVRVHLGMVHSLLKGAIEDEILRRLDRHFA